MPRLGIVVQASRLPNATQAGRLHHKEQLP
jgi:hypothetical protein